MLQQLQMCAYWLTFSLPKTLWHVLHNALPMYFAKYDDHCVFHSNVVLQGRQDLSLFYQSGP